MRASIFRRRLALASEAALARMAPPPGAGFYERGLSSEGFAGGYLAALIDAAAVLDDCQPEDRLGVWKAARAKAKR